MSDVADILGLGQDASSNSLQNKDAANLLQSFHKPKGTMGAPKQKKSKTKISREVLDLIGKDATSVSISTSSNNISGTGDHENSNPPISVPVFKKRRTTAVAANTKNDGWVWAAVSNPGRSDTNDDTAKVRFFHWIRADALPHYQPISLYSKNEEESTLIMASKKFFCDGWTVEDSAALVKACKRYDLRWPIIVDRLRSSLALPAQSTLRTRPIEELKAHYYKINSKSDDRTTEDFTGEAFIKSERVRRLYQDWLFRRTKEDELKESRLREELKTIDGLIRKAKKQALAKQAQAAAVATVAAAPPTTIVAMSTLSMETSHWPPSKGLPTLSGARLHKSDKTKGLSKSIATKLQNYLNGLEIPESLLPTEAVCNMLEEIRGLALEVVTMQGKS